VKKLLIAGLAVVAAALALVAVLTRPDRVPSSRGPLAPAVEIPRAEAPPRAAPPIPESPAARPRAEPVPPAPPPASAAPSPAAAAAELPKDPEGRLEALEPLRRELFPRLADLRGRIAHCESADATLLVVLETLERAVRIVDVRLEPRPAAAGSREEDDAPADERTVHCVRSALVGNVVAAPSATPGRRWEMPLEAAAVD
jgi:hypothetical protein